MLHSQSLTDMRQPRPFRLLLRVTLGCWLLCATNYAFARESDDLLLMLQQADSIKSANRPEFKEIVNDLTRRTSELSVSQRHYLNFLQGWQLGYEGDYDAALALLRPVSTESADVTLQFRAYASSVNILAIARRYEEAFMSLSRLIELLPRVTDRDARSQGIGVAMLLYNQVGQYDLSLNYGNEDISGRGACTVGETRLYALYKSKRLRANGTEFQSVIDACEKAGEFVFAHLVRTYLARSYIDERRFIDAINLLKKNYNDALRTQYPPLVSTYDAWLAYLYRETGDTALARQFALHAAESAVKNEYTEPLANAYRLLYVLAKEQGDLKSALVFHEKYAAADKGRLDDVSARQLAYQRVAHETVANKMQIETLNKQNEVLQLQRSLADKSVETSRLYIIMLVMCLAFVAFIAYRTKRSQLHFMNLSRRDGLTGILNRPHFIELAQSTLESCRKVQQEVCVVLCDLDHFKSVNDKFGHAGGDTVLQRAVAACQTHLRATDIFARIGGEEFGILLPGCTTSDARQRAEQLRVAIASIDQSNDQADTKLSVSASFGITGTKTSGYELRRLMVHADIAMYQAKRAGRNRVVVYGGSDSPSSTDAAYTSSTGEVPA